MRGRYEDEDLEQTEASDEEQMASFDQYQEEEMEAESKEIPIEEEILGIVDIIPVSSSFILEELYKKGKEISVPRLLTVLMELTYSGKIAQNGAYYRKIA
jgi:DNA processing protein